MQADGDSLMQNEHTVNDEALALAEWLESPQCGLLGDERVQRAAALLREFAVAAIGRTKAGKK